MNQREAAIIKLNEFMRDPATHNYERQVIYNGLCNDPVDTIADLEHALQVLKDHYKTLGLIR